VKHPSRPALTVAALAIVLPSLVAGADWVPNGVVVAGGSSNQLLVSACASAGGVIMVWQDRRAASGSDVYAQRLTSDGTVAPGWPASGLPVCSVEQDQTSAAVVSDGAGGAYVAWQDFRSGSDWDLYAQHVTMAGSVAAGWPHDGLAVCAAAGNQLRPVLAGDGAGGLLIAWVDGRSGEGDYDIYAQRVTPAGSIVAGWPTNGAVVCAAPGDQSEPEIVSDGANGLIAVWVDGRLGGTNVDLYALRLTASGARGSGWQDGGTPICQAAGGQFSPTIAADGSGGAIIAWSDFRSGVDVCGAGGDQRNPVAVADGSGGAILAWLDARDGSVNHLFVSRLTGDGAISPGWTTGGNAICTAAGGQFAPALVGDGAGGSVIAWYDNRAGGGNTDVYAESLTGAGQLTPGWTDGGLAVCAANQGQWFPAVVSDGGSGAFVGWHDARSGAGNVIYAQHVAPPPPAGIADGARPVASLDPPRPNPVTNTMQLSFSLPQRTWVTLRLYDPSGRVVRTLAHGTVDAGRHALVWDGRNDRGGRVPAGVYFLQARWSGFEARRKIVKV